MQRPMQRRRQLLPQFEQRERLQPPAFATLSAPPRVHSLDGLKICCAFPKACSPPLRIRQTFGCWRLSQLNFARLLDHVCPDRP